MDREPTSEQVFDILANRRRRYTLHYLLQRGCPVGLRNLSRQIAAWEHEVTPDAVSYDQRRNVYTALKQTHLPSMEGAGIVAYDERDATVELTDAADEFDVYMDVVARGQTIPWGEFYLGMGVLFTSFITAHWLGLVPFTYVSPLGWGAAVSVVIVVVGVVHCIYSRQMRLGRDGPPPELATAGNHATNG